MHSSRGVIVSVCVVVVGIFIVVLATSSHQSSDSSLIGNFKNHERGEEGLSSSRNRRWTEQNEIEGYYYDPQRKRSPVAATLDSQNPG